MIRKIQHEQKVWSNRNFPNQTPWQMLLGIVEEVGELSHAHLKSAQNIRLNEAHLENQKDAIGDIMIFILGYCNQQGYDAQDLLQETWDQVKQRDWIKFPNNGRTE